MNSVLARILSTRQVTDGTSQFSLQHPHFPDRVSHIDQATGALLQQTVLDIRPSVSLEVGFAYGISTLYICDALRQLGTPALHLVLDPFQNGKWRGIGLRNVREAGFGDLVEFHEDRSETCLPSLLAANRRIDFAFIDGLHRFEQAFVEFYYINRLLRPGGVVLFDDARRRSVIRVIRHALTYPAYELYATSEPAPQGGTWKGTIRRRAAGMPAAQRLVRPDVLTRDWELGIAGRCVALRKIAEDDRPDHWDQDF